MTAETPQRALPPFLTARGRLLAALALGLGFYGIASLSPTEAWIGTLPMRLALAWDVVAIAYLGMAFVMMRNPDRARIRARAKVIDINLFEIVAVAVAAGLVSLFAVALVLARARGLESGVRAAHLAVGIVTVFFSWVALHTLFAVHYAHVFYDPAEQDQAPKAPGDKTPAAKPRRDRGGLEFPGEKEPDYWDFVYFSVVIGMTCQVSDVQVTSRALRHLVTAQGVIAFFYNTVVVALAVNIAAGMGS
ncbi:MAG TPA: DUF1345 domain-containing protein [Candidatus Binatia bacterium]|nr:DUF1345 domain-containing protein [Candidatus Binatia bacterium]